MKKWIPIVIVLGMFGWAVFEFFNSDEESAEQFESVDEAEQIEADSDKDELTEIEEPGKPDIGLDVGNIAPDFQLLTLSGEDVKLSDFRGKRVMINFWATWCPPCRAEMPDMQKFYEDKDVAILAVNLAETESSEEDIKNFAEDYELTFPILLDSNLDVAMLYAIQPIPTTYLVDSNGIINNVAFGPLNYDLMVQEFEKME